MSEFNSHESTNCSKYQSVSYNFLLSPNKSTDLQQLINSNEDKMKG